MTQLDYRDYTVVEVEMLSRRWHALTETVASDEGANADFLSYSLELFETSCCLNGILGRKHRVSGISARCPDDRKQVIVALY